MKRAFVPSAPAPPAMRRPLMRDVERYYELFHAEFEKRWFWKHRVLRRAAYGLPHRYRHGKDPERLYLMSLFLGIQFLLGAIAGIVGLLLLGRLGTGHRGDYHWMLLWVMPICAIGGAVLLLYKGPRHFGRNRYEPRIFRPWVYHVLLNLGGAMIIAFCYLLRDLSTAAGVFLIWGAAYSFTFFANGIAAAYVALSLIAYTVVLATRGVYGYATAASFEVAGTILIGLALGVVVAREWSYRQGILLQISDLTHELRSPLTSIVQSFEDPTIATDTRDALVERLHRHVHLSRRLLSVIDSIVFVSRYEAGGDALTVSTFELSSLIRSYFEDHTMTGSVNKRTVVDVRFASCPIEADMSKIVSIISNLHDNAIKHARSRVEVTAWLDNHGVHIRIADDGEGVPVEERDAIFQPFVRGGQEAGLDTGDGPPRGLGVGLGAARTYARQHRGSLELELAATPPSGASFVCFLPRSLIRPSEQTDRNVAPQPSAAVGGEVILVVDDNVNDLMVAGRILRSHGQKPISVSSAEAALAVTRPDVGLVLLDIHLGIEDGRELLPRIREKFGDSVPVVAFTADDPTARERYIHEYGFDDLLPKPLSRAGLPEAILELAKRGGRGDVRP